MTRSSLNGILRRRALLAGAGALLTAPAIAQAPWCPDQPVRLLVGFALGGALDTVARLLAQGMGPALGQQVIVENRPGAGANIAAEAVARSTPNGLTLLMGAFAQAANPSIMRLAYDPLRDLATISQVSKVPPIMLASATAPFGSAAEAVAYARSNPGQLTYGSGGVGTTSHLAPELLAERTGTKLIHVPYRGGAPAMQGLLAGDVMLLCDNPQPVTRAAIEDGKVRALTVMQAERLPDYPTLPAIAELGLGADLTVESWHGVFACGATQGHIVAAVHAAIQSGSSQLSRNESRS